MLYHVIQVLLLLLKFGVGSAEVAVALAYAAVPEAWPPSESDQHLVIVEGFLFDIRKILFIVKFFLSLLAILAETFGNIISIRVGKSGVYKLRKSGCGGVNLPPLKSAFLEMCG